MKRFLAILFLVLGSSMLFQPEADAMRRRGRAAAPAQVEQAVQAGEVEELDLHKVSKCARVASMMATLGKGAYNCTLGNSWAIVRYPSWLVTLAFLWKFGNTYLPHA